MNAAVSAQVSATKAKRRACERAGRWAEYAAAASLILRGYRLVARRHRTPFGELDLIAARGRRIAFVEVKRRPDRDTAQSSLGPHQARRIHNAAAHWLARHPLYREHEIGFDAVFVMPGKWPQFLPDQLQPVS
jgi:putative endonuclease